MQFIDNSSVKDPIVRSLTLFKEKDVESFLDLMAHTQKPISLGFVNQYAYNLCCQNASVASDFEALNFRIRDGQGIRLACLYNYCDPGANLNGTDFIPLLTNYILHRHKNAKLFVFGTQEPWLSKGGRELFRGEAFESVNGFECDEVYVQLVLGGLSKESFTVVVLAMGMPKQERVAKKIIDAANGAVLVICGGAIVDFCAGRFSRAPKIFRTFGMEWFYRLSLEPKRLFKRYVVGVPVFFYFMMKNKRQSR